MWTVTRQHQYLSGNLVVEISSGGLDYTNPDALCQKYPGEFQEFHNPVEAVETAIAIAEAWQKDCPEDKILIDHGGTGGMTMPFDGMELCEDTYRNLREWAVERLAALPKCDRCGEIIEGYPIKLTDDPDWQFCREYCADEWYAENSEPFIEEEEELEEEDV